MQITLEVPDDLAVAAIPVGQSPERAALEALAIEGYRARRLTEYQVRRMMGYATGMEVHALFQKHDVYTHFSEEDLARDIATADRLHAERERRACVA